MYRWPCFLVALLVGVLFAAGCGQTPGSSSASPDPSPPAGQAPVTKLTFALVPAEDAEAMIESFDSLRRHIAKEAGVEVEVMSVTDYSGVVEAMRRGKVDVAWYGPLSYVLARQETGAEAFAIGKKRGADATYKSIFLVRAEDTAQTLANLAGKRIALVDPGSTSGNLVPRSMIKDDSGKTMEEFFGKVVYAGGHDAALMALLSGSVDVCAIQDVTYEQYSKERPDEMKKVRILASSSPIPQSPLAFRKDLDPAIKEKVRRAVLEAHEHGVRLDVKGQGDFEQFVAAGPDDFEPIAKMAQTMGLTRDAMAK